MTFSLNMAPFGTPSRSSGSWQPVSGGKKWKTPSQLRRDQKRKQDFIAKKKASLDNTESVEKEDDKVKELFPRNPKDVKDAVIADNEYLKKKNKCMKKICDVEIFPEDTKNMANFRDKVVEYFEKKKDVIEKVIRCEIKSVGPRLKLVTLVNLSSGWTYFSDPEKNYSALFVNRRILHGCRDLSNCGDPQVKEAG